MVAAVSLDLDGPIIRTRAAEVLIAEVLRSRGHPVSEAEVRRAMEGVGLEWRGEAPSEYYLRLNTLILRRLGVEDRGAAEEIFKRWLDPDNYSVRGDALEAVPELRGMVDYLVVVSNNPGSGVRKVLDSLGLLRYFDLIVTPEVAGAAKPDAGIFRFAAGLLGLDPEHVLHVGDDYELDYLAATRAGMRAVLVCEEPRGDAPCVTNLRELVVRLKHARVDP